MKPIEVGCLVMIVRSGMAENVGKTGQVIEHDPYCPYGGIWCVAIAGNSAGFSVRGKKRSDDSPLWCGHSDIIRIDGGVDDSVTTEHEREVTA